MTTEQKSTESIYVNPGRTKEHRAEALLASLEQQAMEPYVAWATLALPARDGISSLYSRELQVLPPGYTKAGYNYVESGFQYLDMRRDQHGWTRFNCADTDPKYTARANALRLLKRLGQGADCSSALCPVCSDPRDSSIDVVRLTSVGAL